VEQYAVGALCMEEGRWWLEIITNEPYLYLFGPFDTTDEADNKSDEYFQDLEAEGWKIVSSKMTQLGDTRKRLSAPAHLRQ
jgi:Domain of unknown function (DUF1816)